MFREIKDKTITKVFVLVAIFILVVAFSWIFDFGDKGKTNASIDTVTLPVINISYNDYDINLLYGYTQEMDSSYMRNSITPVNDDYTINLNIQECDETISKIVYQVTGLDGENLVQESEISDWSQDGRNAKATLEIENLIRNDTEYVLIIDITTDKHEDIRYYTRIIKPTTVYYNQQVEFVKNFSDATFDPEKMENYSSYLEPDASLVDNSNLGLVTINSNLSRVEWADLLPVKLTEQSISIKEIFGDTASIQLKYIVYSTVGEIKEYYNVNEFYRLRISGDKTYLLDFQREMQQIFEPSDYNISKSSIDLGIDSDSTVEMKSDIKGAYIAFVNEGTLWYMDTKINSITSIFSFSDPSDTDLRKINNQYDMKIISVAENGDMEFLVYGYMNSGEHEGKSGIALYKYNKEKNTVEELLFVPSNRSFGIMDKMIGDLLYVSDSGSLFIMLDNYIYSIDLAGKEYVEIASDISEGNYIISYDQSMVAWHDNGTVNNADSITVLNLETGESCTIKAEEGTKIKALGFLDKDFVYGIAKDENITQDLTQDNNFLMYEINVIDLKKEVLQQENGDGLLFSGAVQGSNNIVLKRVVLNSDQTGYDSVDDLTIFSFGEKAKTTNIEKSIQERKKTVLSIVFINKITTGEDLSKKYINKIAFENTNSLSVRKMSSLDDRYYVYTRGEVSGIFSSLSKAITKADGEMGVITDDSQNYVWIRGFRKTEAAITGLNIVASGSSDSALAICLDGILVMNGVEGMNSMELLNSGKSALNILDENLDGRGLYLKGITVDQSLYFVSQGQPVIGFLDGNSCFVITGYDLKNVTILNPVTGEITKITKEQSEAMFAPYEYRFLTVLEK